MRIVPPGINAVESGGEPCAIGLDRDMGDCRPWASQRLRAAGRRAIATAVLLGPLLTLLLRGALTADGR